MGSINQLQFVKEHRSQFSGPVLEVGSRNYGNTQNLRALFPGEEYVGVDMSAGDGVDLVVDLTRHLDEVDAALNGRRFGSIFCLSVLEHCNQPFAAAQNMTKLLQPGGKLYVSVPFAFKFHGYPSDYWRFTHEGVKVLFSELEFPAELSNWSAQRPGTFPLDPELGLLRISGKWQFRQGHPLRGITAEVLRVFGRLGLFGWLTHYDYLCVPSMVDLIGVKPQLADPSN